MNRQERQVASFVFALIAAGALALHFGKPRFGDPGLIIEKIAVTNELGEIIRDERIHLPSDVSGFHSKEAPITSIEATNLPPDTTYGRKLYWDNEGFRVQMTAIMMKTDRTSIHRPQTCLTGSGWTIDKTEVIDIPVALPKPYVLKATCLTSSKKVPGKITGKLYSESSVYVFWFVAEHQLAPTHSDAVWAITRDLITSGTLYPWGYISCFAPCPPGKEAVALVRLKRLISEAVPEFQLTPPNPKQSAFLQNSVPLH